MIYPDEVKNEVRSQNDIVDVISGYLSLKKSGSNYMCCCPFHQEKTPSFSVSRQKQMFYCFGCQKGGDVITFVQEYEHVNFMEAMKILADRVGYKLPGIEMSREEKQKMDRKTKLREINTVAAGYFHFLLTKSDRGKLGYAYYKEKRRFTDETIKNFGLGYADVYADDLYQYLRKRGYPDDLIRDTGLVDFSEKYGPQDKFWNRVMVPILDIQGKCIGFGGRVLGDAKPKYMNTRETEVFDKSHNLFALNIARRSRRRGMILCEGYMDVITQHQAGFDNAVASLGTAFTQGQAEMIRRYTNEVYLAYDSDNAGIMAAKKAIALLQSLKMSQRVIDLSPYKDPDEFLAAEGAEAYEERIRNAVPGRIFEIRQIRKDLRFDDPEEKAEFVRKAAEIIAGIEDVAKRASYIEAVSKEYSLDQEVFRQEVTRIGLSGIKKKNNDDQTYGAGRDAPGDSGRGQPQKRPREVGYSQNQAVLLTWMVDRPELFRKLKAYISAEDFSGKAREVAEKLYRQMEEKGAVQPAVIIGDYIEESDQSEVAGILAQELPRELSFSSDTETVEKALTELVRKVKTEREDEAMRKKEGSMFEHARRKNEIQKLVVKLA